MTSPASTPPAALPDQGPLPMPGATLPGAAPRGEGRSHYGASRGRATAFSFIFLILLPFFVSLPAMLFMRAKSGHWDSSLGLVVFGLGFAAIMLLVLSELLFSIRAHIDLGDKSVRMTLPTGRGLLPMLRYQRHDIPYADIVGVETRREIYGGALTPVMMRGARIVTRDGGAIQLGYLNEANVDPAFPYAEIADAIAARAGVTVADRGAVRRKVANKMMGIRAVDDGSGAIEEDGIADLNRRHARVVTALVAGLVLLVGVGIVGDLMSPADPVAGQPQAKPAAAKAPPAIAPVKKK